MLERISNSWELVKASAAVLRADKELIVFPIVSSIGVLIVTATFALPMLLAGFLDTLLAGQSEVAGVVVAFLFYVVQYLVIFSANTALVGAAMIRLQGGDPTVRDGLRITYEHLGQILGYALIAATVGMILRWVSERGGTVGRIASSLVGLAWNVATFLVVPVLVVEDVGPIDAVKRSAELLKRTWGEQIAGNLSIGLIFGLLSVVALLLGVPVIVLAIMSESIALVVLAVLVLVLVLIFLALINSTLSGIYRAAVYRYAVTGEAGYFRQDLVENAFRHKST
ncbi:MAG: hypothetical protein MAG451_03158 [Anaerolineales bacterium]|nr:hypothetical protein [Anaerolineales bacterium]